VVGIEVARGDLHRSRVVMAAAPSLGDGEARLRVDRFGFSSNNVTYAVVGEALRYWDFFPAADAAEGDATTWGRIPVWGFGDVVETRSPDVTVGERLFGYYPMSSELVIVPGRAGAQTVSDISAHRAEMARAYNSYQRCRADPMYRADREGLQMVLYPLFFTSFVIDDFLSDNGDFGSEHVVISSASAKTAIGTAFLLHGRGRRVVGLTSAANTEFVLSLGVYDDVVTYSDAGTLEAVASVYIDVSGNEDLRRVVHGRLGDALRHSMIVGDTHWDHQPAPVSEPLPGPAPRFLFAPKQIAKRTAQWGAEELNTRVAGAWDRFTSWVPTWLELRHVSGTGPVTDLYDMFVSGKVDPTIGYVCALDAGGSARV